MPKDTSIKSVLIIGSGPIIIGQACEFDYAGSQAARSIREEGIEVILINSNPATIMTDPFFVLPPAPSQGGGDRADIHAGYLCPGLRRV